MVGEAFARLARARRLLLLLLLLLLGAMLSAGAPAQASDGIVLRQTMCAAVAGEALSPAEVARLDLECGRAPEAYREGWLWLRTTQVARLGELPAGWRLLVDMARFKALEVVVTHRDGSVQRIRRAADELERDWSVGGDLVFTIARPGAEVAAVSVGFHRLATLGEVRNIKAFAPATYQVRTELWLLVIGAAVGIALFSLAYNLFLYAGLRYPFQRAYLLWSGSVLLLALFLSNAAFFALPELAGPAGMRLNYLFAATTIGTGTLFFLSFVEEGMLPRRLVRAGRVVAWGVMGLGVLCAADRVVPPALVERLNLVLYLANPFVLLAGLGIAIARGSRNSWYFLAGWCVPLAIYVLRLGRTLAGMPQSNLVDMVTLGGLALESIILSLAMADRFRGLRRERDRAREEQHAAEVERRTLERVAWTDMLTGLNNRAAFDRFLHAADGTPATLVLVDLDQFKPINDGFGHAAGDAVLRQIGEMLRARLPEGVLAARVGGDEFGFLVPPGDQARLEGLVAALEGVQGMAWAHEEAHGNLRFSIGLASAPAGGWPSDLLYRNADLALYEAKVLGRGGARRYAPPRREGEAAAQPAPCPVLLAA